MGIGKIAGDVEGSGGDSAERGGGWWVIEGLPWIGKQWLEWLHSNSQGFGLTICFNASQ